MSDEATNDKNAGEKVGNWTEEQKVELLLRVWVTNRSDTRGVQWAKVEMPGRTRKGLQNQWVKMMKQAAELGINMDGDDDDAGAAKTPVKRTHAKKRGKKAVEAEADADAEAADGDDDKEGRTAAADGSDAEGEEAVVTKKAGKAKATATPRKRKAPGETPTKRKRAAKKADADAEAGGDAAGSNSDAATPPVKRKRAVKKAVKKTPEVVAEGADDSEEDADAPIRERIKLELLAEEQIKAEPTEDRHRTPPSANAEQDAADGQDRSFMSPLTIIEHGAVA